MCDAGPPRSLGALEDEARALFIRLFGPFDVRVFSLFRSALIMAPAGDVEPALVVWSDGCALLYSGGGHGAHVSNYCDPRRGRQLHKAPLCPRLN
jgi:hypothetical protein